MKTLSFILLLVPMMSFGQALHITIETPEGKYEHNPSNYPGLQN